MSTKPIGVFDSGLGGLTAVRQLAKVLPNENVVYFGDTGRVPYGSRSNDIIRRYAMQDARFLLSHDVKMLIAACGTVSSVAYDLGEKLDVLFTGVVRPTAYAAVQRTKNGKIGIIGTTATVNSHSYKREIERFSKEVEVVERDCPLFVPLVESGFVSADDPIVKLTVERYLEPIMSAEPDTVILGCTHYPILKEAISRYVGSSVALIDSGRETALYSAKLLEQNGLLNTQPQKTAKHEFYVSDTPNGFVNVAEIFLGEDMQHNVTQIDIEQY